MVKESANLRPPAIANCLLTWKIWKFYQNVDITFHVNWKTYFINCHEFKFPYIFSHLLTSASFLTSSNDAAASTCFFHPLISLSWFSAKICWVAVGNTHLVEPIKRSFVSTCSHEQLIVPMCDVGVLFFLTPTRFEDQRVALQSNHLKLILCHINLTHGLLRGLSIGQIWSISSQSITWVSGVMYNLRSLKFSLHLYRRPDRKRNTNSFAPDFGASNQIQVLFPTIKPRNFSFSLFW